MVAPYSGDMLPIVARSGTGKEARAFAVKFDKFPDHFLRAQASG